MPSSAPKWPTTRVIKMKSNHHAGYLDFSAGHRCGFERACSTGLEDQGLSSRQDMLEGRVDLVIHSDSAGYSFAGDTNNP